MIKKLFYLLIVISLLIPVISCQNSSGSPPPVVTDTANTFPFYFTLKLSEIPQLGQTAELSFSFGLQMPSLLDDDQPKEGLANGKAWLDFYWINPEGSYSDAKHGVLVPLSEVLINGTTNIQGNVREQHNMCTIKLPHEGIWKIVGNVQGEGWQSPETITKMYVIADGYTFNYGFTPNPELAASPLSYLQYFNYGRVGYPVLSENNPIIQELNISKAPLTGETVTIAVKITSLHDISGFSSDIRFFNNTSNQVIPGENLYIRGDLSWSGDLKANEPVQYSVDIKFPEEGEWKIGTIGVMPNDSRMFQNRMEITINKTTSFYGWKPSHKIETTQPEITQPEEPAPFNWLPIIIAVPVVVILGGVLAFLLIRRKRR